MKVLDVAPFQEGLQQNLTMLRRLRSEMKTIETSIKGLVALEDSLKGEGGNTIRSFYEECHLPFLLFFDHAMEDFELKLRTMRLALISLEPSSEGYIKEEFLEVDVEAGLTEIARLTVDLTDEANSILAQVNDIVSLPRLDDSDVHEGVQRAKARRTETVQQLNEFDAEQTQALVSVETDIGIMENWLADLDGLFNGGLTDVNFPVADWAAKQQHTPISKLSYEQKYNALDSHPRVTDNDVEIFSQPAHANDGIWEGFASTTGVSINDWKETPINAFSSLGLTAYTVYGAAQDINLARQGFGIMRTTRTTAQGKTKVVIKLNRPDLIGVRKKTYSHTNATNYTKIFRRVDPITNMKQSLKFAGNKIGYIGIGTAVVGDIYHGSAKNLPKTEIAGNVTGSLTVGVTTIASSAIAAAQVGAAAGVIGGPIGVLAGAAAALVVGVVVPTFFNEIKVVDVDGDGRRDSLGDTVKKGTTGLLNQVSSWLK